MNKIITALKSRTVWTIVVLVIINGVPAVVDLLPENWLPVVSAVVGLLGAYFRVNPRA